MSKLLIVGGSTGIGLQLAKQLSEYVDYEVVVTGRNSQRLSDVKSLIPDLTTLQLDLENVSKSSLALKQLGGIDHLVLVGSSDIAWGAFPELSLDQVMQAFNVKTMGYLRALQHLLPQLSHKASITIVGGAAGRKAMPGTVGLAVVNGALQAATRTLAAELAPKRVNLVSPGLTDTEAYDEMPAEHKASMFEGAAASLPLQKTGLPSDIASVIDLAVKNNFMTGAIIDVDGGATL